MSGSFASASQAAQDSSYLDIRLRMRRVWPLRPDGYWLYVEQATEWSQDHPYRQRIYHLTHVGGDLFQSEVFELPHPERFVGAWRDPTLLDSLAPDSLVSREGCEIVLRWLGTHFAGSTLGRLCPSSLRGAAYATSEVVVEEERFISWDRGFAADGTQVWGATAGPYVFQKIATFELD